MRDCLCTHHITVHTADGWATKDCSCTSFRPAPGRRRNARAGEVDAALAQPALATLAEFKHGKDLYRVQENEDGLPVLMYESAGNWFPADVHSAAQGFADKAQLLTRARTYREDATRFEDAIKTGACPEGEAPSWQRFAEVYRLVATELEQVAREEAA